MPVQLSLGSECIIFNMTLLYSLVVQLCTLFYVSGTYGGSIKLVAETMREVLTMYDSMAESLKDIHIVDINPGNISAFISEFGQIEFSSDHKDGSSDLLVELNFADTKHHGDCPICFDTKTLKIVSTCKHEFCEECLMRSIMSMGPKCPLCNSIFGAMIGNQPKEGTMDERKDHHSKLPGYESCGVIVIDYTFPDGIQQVCMHLLLCECIVKNII